MADKISMSLHEIIKESKQNKPRRSGGAAGPAKGGRAGAPAPRGGRKSGPTSGPAGGGGRNSGGVTAPHKSGGVQKRRSGGAAANHVSPRAGSKVARGDMNSAWKHDMFEGGKKLLRAGATLGGGVAGGTAKLLVSNLDYGVSETDIHELFADFGPLKTASVHYDRSGRSLGTADVVFERRADAVKAMKQYNGVPLDGRPMNIQLATSELPPVASLTPVRARTSAPNGGGRVQQQKPQQNNRRNGAQSNGRPASGGGQRQNGNAAGGGRKQQPAKKTAAELDAELDAYVNDMKV